MKHKRINLIGAVCAILLALGCTANALTFGDGNDLGSIVSGEPAKPTAEQGYINTLIAQSSPSGPTTIAGHAYTRKNTSCGTCPAAVFDSKSGDNPSGSVDLGAGGFTYLLGKYDGPNGGDEVWNVQGLTGIVSIPLNGFGKNNSQYGLSHWSLFGGGTPVVPDGGATAALLGLGLAGLAGIRAKFGRN